MPKKDVSLENQQLLGQLSAKVDMLLEESKTIGVAVYGNGDPMQGLAAAMIRVEGQLSAAVTACDLNAKSVGALTKNVDTLAASVSEHHKSIHLYNLLKSPKFWGYGLLAFVLANLLIDVGNPIIMSLIKAWTGISFP